MILIFLKILAITYKNGVMTNGGTSITVLINHHPDDAQFHFSFPNTENISVIMKQVLLTILSTSTKPWVQHLYYLHLNL